MKKRFVLPSLILALLIAGLFVAVPHMALAHTASIGDLNARAQEQALLNSGVSGLDGNVTAKVLNAAELCHVIVGGALHAPVNTIDWGNHPVSYVAFSSGMHTEEDASSVVRIYNNQNQQPCP